MRRAIVASGVLGALLSLPGCGGGEPPAKEPEPVAMSPQKAVPLVAKTLQELGSVDPAAVKRAFAALDDKFTECQKRALDRVGSWPGR
jgi:hypothetical protein